jgi:hypothetical protein
MKIGGREKKNYIKKIFILFGREIWKRFGSSSILFSPLLLMCKSHPLD